MGALTKEALLALKPRMEAVPMPELGEGAELWVREMNGLDVLDYGGMYNEATGGGKGFDKLPVAARHAIMGFLLERTVCNADGTRMFADGEAKQAPIPWSAMQRLWDAANRINQMTDADAPKKSSDETPTSISRVA